MESDHPEFTPDDHYLFAQLSKIEADASVAEAAFEIAEAESRSAEFARQFEMLDKLAETLDDPFVGMLRQLYEEDVAKGRQTTSFDIGRHLNDAINDTEPDNPNYRILLHLDGLNDVIMDTSTGSLDGDTFVPTFAKEDAQMNILQYNQFNPEVKRQLLEFIDTVLPGEPLDLSDIENISRILEERRHQSDTVGERRQRGTIVENEFARFGLSKADPEYDTLVGLMKALVNGGYDEATLSHFYDGTGETLRVLGISHEQFASTIHDIFERLKSIDLN